MEKSDSVSTDLPDKKTEEKTETPAPHSYSEPLSNVDHLKESVLRTLKKRFTVCVTLKRGEWQLNAGSLDLIFESKFDTTFIKGESSQIQEAVKNITGKSMAVKVRQKVSVKQEEETEEIMDERIDIVKAAFRGEIIKTGE